MCIVLLLLPVLSAPQAVKRWFRFRQHKRVKKSANPWPDIIHNLQHGIVTARRRTLPAWQLFMSEQHAAVVEEYCRRFPDRSDKQRAKDINGRSSIARELFKQLEQDEQDEYEQQAKVLFEQEVADAMAKHEQAKSAILSADVEA